MCAKCGILCGNPESSVADACETLRNSHRTQTPQCLAIVFKEQSDAYARSSRNDTRREFASRGSYRRSCDLPWIQV